MSIPLCDSLSFGINNVFASTNGVLLFLSKGRLIAQRSAEEHIEIKGRASFTSFSASELPGSSDILVALCSAEDFTVYIIQDMMQSVIYENYQRTLAVSVYGQHILSYDGETAQIFEYSSLTLACEPMCTLPLGPTVTCITLNENKIGFATQTQMRIVDFENNTLLEHNLPMKNDDVDTSVRSAFLVACFSGDALVVGGDDGVICILENGGNFSTSRTHFGLISALVPTTGNEFVIGSVDGRVLKTACSLRQQDLQIFEHHGCVGVCYINGICYAALFDHKELSPCF
ncbi:hypothetical protein PCE1_005012 [Barthelona sp. PCE]